MTRWIHATMTALTLTTVMTPINAPTTNKKDPKKDVSNQGDGVDHEATGLSGAATDSESNHNSISSDVESEHASRKGDDAANEEFVQNRLG